MRAKPKAFLSINKLFKNTNVSQLGTGINPTTALYSKTTKPEIFLDVKITKRAHAFKIYAHSCNFETLKSFNPELQLKNTESTIKNKVKKFVD